MAIDRKATPGGQYVQTVASGVTVLLLAWIGNTLTVMSTDVAKLTVAVNRHERDISELQAEVRRKY